jgi:hypothetical protein
MDHGPAARRLVVYIGPPKTASTSLQRFLANHAGPSKGKREKAFEGWNYPMFMGDKNGIRHIHSIDPHGKRTLAAVKAVASTLRGQNPSKNLVVASESLTAYHRILDGRLFEKLSEWTNVAQPEIVIFSRSPRIDHLISIWKQQTLRKGKKLYGWPFRKYMCSNKAEKLVRRLGRFANPVGMAHDMVHIYNLPTYVMDMAGIARQRSDVCHMFACKIMKVNCTKSSTGENWVKGLEGVTIHANSKYADPKLSMIERREIEILFHQRDCAYRDELYNHSLFHLHYRHDGFWPEDCTNTEAMPVYRYNTTIMLNDIRQIINCPDDESGHIQQQQVKLRISPPNQLPLQAAAFLVVALLVAILGMTQRARRKRKTGSVKLVPLANQDEGKPPNLQSRKRTP